VRDFKAFFAPICQRLNIPGIGLRRQDLCVTDSYVGFSGDEKCKTSLTGLKPQSRVYKPGFWQKPGLFSTCK
jgi:hypothetical protein